MERHLSWIICFVVMDEENRGAGCSQLHQMMKKMVVMAMVKVLMVMVMVEEDLPEF